MKFRFGQVVFETLSHQDLVFDAFARSGQGKAEVAQFFDIHNKYML